MCSAGRTRTMMRQLKHAKFFRGKNFGFLGTRAPRKQRSKREYTGRVAVRLINTLSAAYQTALYVRDDTRPFFALLCASLYCAIRALKRPNCINRDCAKAPGLGDGVSGKREGPLPLPSSMSGEHDRRGWSLLSAARAGHSEIVPRTFSFTRRLGGV